MIPAAVFRHFPGDVEIPVREHLKNRKLSKYFNRETAALVTCAAILLAGREIPAVTPFAYAMGQVEHEDYGLQTLGDGSRGSNDKFCHDTFIATGIANVSPLTQFKVLYNMPLCFVSIEHGLIGENAILYGTATSDVRSQVECMEPAGKVLLGAGHIHHDGSVDVGIALLEGDASLIPWETDADVLSLLKTWAGA